MHCPECKATEDIVYFLRHAPVEGEDNEDETDANAITILCKNCGNNESYLIEDLLEEIFTDWSDKNLFAGIFAGMNGINQDFDVLSNNQELIDE